MTAETERIDEKQRPVLSENLAKPASGVFPRGPERSPVIFDISPPITPSLAVWPGDTPPSREVLLDIAGGATVTLSTLRATAHLGAHADAPSHCCAGAPSIDERNLDLYMGPCQVIRVAARPRTRIGPGDLDAPVRAPRVLFATGTYPDPTRFREDFAALEPALISDLAGKGVRLVGIDTPSVDLYDSRDLPSHQAFLSHDMAILEGLVLAGVPEGLYELVALPLRLAGFDASPVRAILRELPSTRE
ncbi:MAG: cyclase family protein [Planctomycetes bacterium]|nr:cyclase family protein [Planctomycetota bacterium]